MGFVDKIAAGLVCIIGAAHLAVGHAAFTHPSEARIWFASAGLLLIVTGLANLGAQSGVNRMQSFAAAVGGLSILMIGTLLALADPDLLTQPQTLTLFALGLILTVNRLRELVTPKRI